MNSNMNNWGAKKIVVLQNVPAEVVECEDITNPNILECYLEDYQEENTLLTEPESYYQQQFDDSSSFEPISPAPIMNELELHSELIIEAVQGRPALWNIRDGGYKSRDIRARLWEEVVTESNFTVTRDNVTRVRKHWETIKATYKRSKNRTPSGSKGGYQKPYKFAKLLSFLDDTNEPRRSIELGGDTESTVDSNRLDDFEEIIPKKKKKLNYQGEAHELQRRYVEALERKLTVPPSTSVATPPTPDSIDMFLGSLKPYLESLSLTSRLKAQQKMMSSLIESLQEEEEKTKN